MYTSARTLKIFFCAATDTDIYQVSIRPRMRAAESKETDWVSWSIINRHGYDAHPGFSTLVSNATMCDARREKNYIPVRC